MRFGWRRSDFDVGITNFVNGFHNGGYFNVRFDYCRDKKCRPVFRPAGSVIFLLLLEPNFEAFDGFAFCSNDPQHKFEFAVVLVNLNQHQVLTFVQFYFVGFLVCS
jgi:hypothetical protein